MTKKIKKLLCLSLSFVFWHTSFFASYFVVLLSAFIYTPGRFDVVWLFNFCTVFGMSDFKC